MNNYEFCAQWIVDNSRGRNPRVLDFGCGAGHIVEELRRRGVDAFGCDVFYEGGDYAPCVNPKFVGGVIKRMESGVIPFPDRYFDSVVSNQVLEHVESLDQGLSEICRVMRPGGVVLSLFPDKGVWREGHCGVPFLHWFPKGSRSRVYFAAAFRGLGFGHYKGNKSVMSWSQEFCHWLDKWTWYRSPGEIRVAFGKHFAETQPLEDYWLRARFGSRHPIVNYLPRVVQRFVVRKLGGRVFASYKPVEEETRLATKSLLRKGTVDKP